MRTGAILLALFGAVPLSQAGSVHSVAREVAAIERTTVQIRGLRPLHRVRAAFPSNRVFNVILSKEMHRDNPAADIAVSQREAVLLGLLSSHDNLYRITFRGLGSQVLGFYDPSRQTLYVRKDAKGVFGPQRYVIAHEYTHALQDQHYNLRHFLPDESHLRYRNSDALNARHALTEGDAMNVGYQFIYRTYSARAVRALMALQAHQRKGPSLPRAIEREFYFPYTYGLAFVQRLYRRGGMKMIDAAFRRPPVSTYQIIYPGAYLHHWQPISVRLHGVQGFDSWRQVDDDVFGAFGYRLLLRQFLSSQTADRVSRAYRGDRYIFLERGRGSMILLKSIWNSGAAVRRTETALVAGLRQRFDHRVKVLHRSGLVVTDRAGAVYFRARGTWLTVVYAPNVGLARRLASARTY